MVAISSLYTNDGEKLPDVFTYVWLKSNHAQPHFFFCCTCRNPVLRYQGYVASLIPAGNEAMHEATTELMQFPLEAKCTNKNCPAKYIFEGFTV